jgi:hypothetical protein
MSSGPSQHAIRQQATGFGFKYMTHGPAKTNVKALTSLFRTYTPWEIFQSDGGSHFDNEEVRVECADCEAGYLVQVYVATYIEFSLHILSLLHAELFTLEQPTTVVELTLTYLIPSP